MATIGDLVANIKCDSRQFTSGLQKSQRSLGGFVKSSVGGLASIGLAAQGLGTVFGLLSGPLNEAREGMAATKKLTQVFKSTAGAAGLAVDDIKAFADERERLTNFAGDDTVNAAALLGSFTNVKGGAFTEALTSAQDLSAFLGQDLQSSILQIGKALNDPAKGLTALTRAGVGFTQQQKDQIKALQETGKIAEAQSIIFAEMRTQFGGQAEALSDPITIAQNAWANAMEEMGMGFQEHLLPVMPQIIEGVKAVAKFIGDTVSNISEMVSAIDDVAFAAAALVSGVDVGHAMSERAIGKELGLAKKQGLAAMAGPMAERQQSLRSGIADTLAGAAQNKLAFDSTKSISIDEPQIDMTGVPAYTGSKTLGDVRAMNRETEQVKSLNVISQLDDMLAMQGAIPIPKSSGPMNQVGSLEQGSAEAFDVLRANTSPGGGKNVGQKQLTEAQKQTKLLEKLLKKKDESKGSNYPVVGID